MQDLIDRIDIVNKKISELVAHVDLDSRKNELAAAQKEAEAIRLKGEAEAEAMRKKAEAMQLYGQAAMMEMVADKLLELLEKP